MKRSVHQALLLVAVLSITNTSIAADKPSERVPDPNRGLYAIWAKPKQQDLSFLKGGQIYLQWKEVQPAPSRYDFSKLDAALKKAHAAGRPATVQINGNRRPDFLFAQVPYHPKRLSVQVGDKQGTLMFWHPAHLKAYLGLIEAYGRHLRQSPHKDAVLGVRLNFNSIGTEHLNVEKAYRSLDQWTTPPGVQPGTEWNRPAMEHYKRQVVAAFVKHFTPDVSVFVRNNVILDASLDPALLEQFETGRLCLFHTSSEVEPRPAGERRYQAFIDYARSGKTLAYAECWADAWGRHGGKTDPRWCSPCQWNYWRLLVDLHCGVSFIGIYGSDLAHADEPEFDAAFQFAARYAGYHASPSVAPGAWVALREGNYLKGDYTFLMTRLPGDATTPIANAGPDDQRYGAWARIIPAGGRARFQLDDRFAASLNSNDVTVRIVYLDDHSAPLRLDIAGKEETVIMRESGRWQAAEFALSGNDLRKPNGEADITITSDQPLTLHMVEVQRAQQ
jgi:hypothetical protein